MRVGLAQIKPHLGRVDLNIEKHVELIHRAQEEQVDLLVFPELSLTGYNLLDLTFEMTRDPFSPDIQSMIRTTGKMDMVFGFVEQSPEYVIYNSTAYVSAQQIAYLHRKLYLPTYGMFDEGRYFGKGQAIRSIPTRFGQVGIACCEDMWHPTVPFLLTQDGAHILIVPANSPVKSMNHQGLGSRDSWYNILKAYAILHGTYILFVNRVGSEDGITFFGGSVVVDPFGNLEAKAQLLEEDLLVVELDLEKIRKARFQMPLLRDERLDLTIREANRILRKQSGEGW